MAETPKPRLVQLTPRLAMLLAVLMAVGFFSLALASSLNKSLTWDEPSYIAAGYTQLGKSDFRLNPSHPPLTQQLIAAPLMFLDLQEPQAPVSEWIKKFKNPAVTYATALLYRSPEDIRRIAFWARLPIILLGTGLMLAIFLWGRRLFGDAAALLATALACWSPNLIAHARLATEDLACACFMFLAVWSFWWAGRGLQARRWILCGGITGLALISKYTALLLGPIYLILWLWEWWRRHESAGIVFWLKAAAIMLGMCLLVVWAGYHFGNPTLYLSGLSEIYADLATTPRSYLMGEPLDHSVWYYYLVTFILKVPESTMAILVLALVLAVRDGRHRDAAVFLLVPALVVLLASFFDERNFGLRRILPAFPFLLLCAGLALVGRWKAPGAARDSAKPVSLWLSIRRYVCVGLVAWTVIASVRIFPHYLSYFNDLAGGPDNGPHLLSDSNIDWGQDLPALAQWQRQHPADLPLRLRYFGTARPAAYGVSAAPLEWHETLAPGPGTYAVSVSSLATLRRWKKRNPEVSDWLSEYRPIDRAGYSILIYRFP